MLPTKTHKGHYFGWTKPKMWLDSIKEAFKVHFAQKMLTGTPPHPRISASVAIKSKSDVNSVNSIKNINTVVKTILSNKHHSQVSPILRQVLIISSKYSLWN